MNFRLFLLKFENLQGSTMVFQNIFKIFKIPKMEGGGGGWAKLKLYTTFVNVVKNTDGIQSQFKKNILQI